MTAALAQTRSMTIRHLRELWRQPWYVAITLVQPLIWLLLFGALFERAVEIPGFGGDYVDFLTPGIVVMTALFTAGWSGMGVIEDLNRGVMDRFLVSPVSRGSLIAGRLGQLAITIAIQSLVVVGLGLAVGARFPGGLAGVAVLVACSVLLAWAVGALSIGLALVARRRRR
jgi:ABC-2 type transport system permease protein